MIFVKPIPIEVLIHEAVYEEISSNTRYGEAFLPPVTLKNIRINHEKSLQRSSNSEGKNIKATMFFDLVNSRASGEFEFKEKSKLTFDGLVMQVQKVNPVYASKLHHYEVELI
jgi:hypothetical protein